MSMTWYGLPEDDFDEDEEDEDDEEEEDEDEEEEEEGTWYVSTELSTSLDFPRTKSL
jgi:hypothetical protein